MLQEVVAIDLLLTLNARNFPWNVSLSVYLLGLLVIMFCSHNLWIGDDDVACIPTIQTGLICMVFISSIMADVLTCVLLYLFPAIALIIIDPPSPFASSDFTNLWQWGSVPSWIQLGILVSDIFYAAIQFWSPGVEPDLLECLEFRRPTLFSERDWSCFSKPTLAEDWVVFISSPFLVAFYLHHRPMTDAGGGSWYLSKHPAKHSLDGGPVRSSSSVSTFRTKLLQNRLQMELTKTIPNMRRHNFTTAHQTCIAVFRKILIVLISWGLSDNDLIYILAWLV